jgi:hypothetical protein
LTLESTSPSVYLIINTLMAGNKCGDEKWCQIGPTAKNEIFAMDLTDVSTLVPARRSNPTERASIAPLTLNDLATDCPQATEATYTGPQKHWELSKNFASYTMDPYNRCNPRLAIPMAIKQYGYPYWNHCNIWGNKFGWFDPPGAVPTVAGILPTLVITTTADSKASETSLEAFRKAATSMPSVTRASVTTKPTVSASDVQERPDADTGITVTGDPPTASSPSSPDGGGKQAWDGLADPDAVVILDSASKSGTTRSVIAVRPTETNPTAPSANAVAHKDDDSDLEDRPVAKVQDEKPKPPANAIANDDLIDPKDQPVITKLLITTSPTTRPSESHPTAASADAGAVAHKKDNSDPKDQPATKVQDDDDEPNTSNGAARILASIFHGIPHNSRTVGSAATGVPENTHGANHGLDIGSETFDTPTAAGAEASPGRPGIKSSSAASLQSIGKTDGNDDDDDDGELAMQGVPAGVAAASLESNPRVSDSPAFADGESPDEPAHAVPEEGSAHPPPSTEKTDPGPVEMMVKGHATSAGIETQDANADLTGGPEAKDGEGEFDFVDLAVPTSIVADESVSSRPGEQVDGLNEPAVDDHEASGTATPAAKSPTTSENFKESASGATVVDVDGHGVVASPPTAVKPGGMSDDADIALVGGDENPSVGPDRTKDRHPDDSDLPSPSAIATGTHDQANRIVGDVALTDARDSFPSTASPAATAAASDSNFAEEHASTASPTKDVDASSTLTQTPMESDEGRIVGNSATAQESLGGLGGTTATGTESLPSPTMLSNPSSLPSAIAQANSVPSSKDENSGTRSGVAVGSGYLLAALYAMVFYHF